MTRWSKGETVFPIKLHYSEGRGCLAVIPKPILDLFGTPKGITFRRHRNGVAVVPSDGKKIRKVAAPKGQKRDAGSHKGQKRDAAAPKRGRGRPAAERTRRRLF